MLAEKDLQLLKEQLEKEGGELDAEVARHSKMPNFGNDVESDMSEEADETEEYVADLGIKDSLKGRLSDIENALDKLTKNAYGKCEQCGKDISLELLKVNPESRLCKECKLK